LSDQAFVTEIRRVPERSVFHREAHLNVWARLRHKGVRVWRERVSRVMRPNQMPSPHRHPDLQPANPHAGRIIVEAPSHLWGADTNPSEETRTGMLEKARSALWPGYAPQAAQTRPAPAPVGDPSLDVLQPAAAAKRGESRRRSHSTP
jgi:hypothetical protein